MIRGFLVNRFRGDPRLFDDGLRIVTEHTGWPSLGLVPWFSAAHRLPAEDAVALATAAPAKAGARIRVAVPMLPRIANFDDLDPLKQEPAVEVVFVPRGSPLPGDAALVVLPGSKATIADLAVLRAEGWDVDLAAHVRRGGRVLGLCGGYQMLGRSIADPDGIEGPPGVVEGLGLLAVDTVLTADKVTRPASGVEVASGLEVAGYEIHLGRTEGPDCARPFAMLAGRPDGATSADGLVAGTYLHGAFAGDAVRAAFLARLGVPSALFYEAGIEATLDALADHLAEHVHTERLLSIARERQTESASATAAIAP